MMRRVLFCFLCLLCLLPGFAFAANTPDEEVLKETFTDRKHVNEEKTNATVDTKAGEVRLPKVSGLQSFHATDDAFIQVEGNEIKFYRINQSGQFEYDAALSRTLGDGIVGVQFAPNGWDHVVLTESGDVIRFQYTGAEFLENPAYRLSGFQSAISLAVTESGVSVFDRNKIWTADELGSSLGEKKKTYELETEPLYFTGGTESELVITDDEKNVHVLSYDGQEYLKNPLYSLDGVGPSSRAQDVLTAVKDGVVSSYHYGMELLSFSHTGAVSAVATEGGAVYVRDADGVSRYMFNGTEYLEQAKLTGLGQIKSTYLTPRQWESTAYTLPKPLQRFGIKYTATTPEKTDVKLYISSDGVSFQEAKNESMVDLQVPVSEIYLRAVLATEDKTKTPILHDIVIYDRTLFVDRLITTDIVRNPGGNPPLPTPKPVRLYAGFNFSFEVFAPGASSVDIEFSNGERVSCTDKGGFIFAGTHFFPGDSPNMAIDAKVIAKDASGKVYEREYPAHYLIVGNLNGMSRVIDTK
ncbi:hypothetical protein [Aneurinibacillus aneurinilyticus]|uniref:hypothetical protein n=1 Tax=Aneurinibacillus aneurinilyticus TaxID=1391 RepID=UPI003523CC3B